MKYLLDTHVALWLFEGNEKLPQKMRDIIFNVENDIYVSIISVWEVAIKVSLGKLDFDGGSKVFLTSVKTYSMDSLGIKDEYITTVEQLPYIHRDPFDRLLISIALTENLIIITADENIQRYNVDWVW